MNLKNGISAFSIFLILSGINLLPREIELQYHEVKAQYSPDFGKLKKAGFDKIIVRSFLNNGKDGGLLFENDYFHVAYPGFNTILKNYKKKNSVLWGWLIARNYDWLDKEDLYDTSFRKGERFKIRKLDLFDPGVRKIVIGVFRDLAESGVDGILIQDDLSIKSDEGFSINGMRAFSNSSGVPAKEKLMMDSGSPYNLRWIKIKKELINKFLSEIVKECKSVNPEIQIGVNVYYESSILERESNEWHSQGLKGIAGSGVDLIYLMMYHRQMKRELKFGLGKIKKLFRKGIEDAYGVAGDRLVVKMETYDWKKGEIIPLDEMIEFIGLIPEKVKRICFTPVKNAGIKYLKGLLRASEN